MPLDLVTSCIGSIPCWLQEGATGPGSSLLDLVACIGPTARSAQETAGMALDLASVVQGGWWYTLGSSLLYRLLITLEYSLLYRFRIRLQHRIVLDTGFHALKSANTFEPAHRK